MYNLGEGFLVLLPYGYWLCCELIHVRIKFERKEKKCLGHQEKVLVIIQEAKSLRQLQLWIFVVLCGVEQGFPSIFFSKE